MDGSEVVPPTSNPVSSILVVSEPLLVVGRSSVTPSVAVVPPEVGLPVVQPAVIVVVALVPVPETIVVVAEVAFTTVVAVPAPVANDVAMGVVANVGVEEPKSKI